MVFALLKIEVSVMIEEPSLARQGTPPSFKTKQGEGAEGIYKRGTRDGVVITITREGAAIRWIPLAWQQLCKFVVGMTDRSDQQQSYPYSSKGGLFYIYRRP